MFHMGISQPHRQAKQIIEFPQKAFCTQKKLCSFKFSNLVVSAISPCLPAGRLFTEGTLDFT